MASSLKYVVRLLNGAVILKCPDKFTALNNVLYNSMQWVHEYVIIEPENFHKLEISATPDNITSFAFKDVAPETYRYIPELKFYEKVG